MIADYPCGNGGYLVTQAQPIAGAPANPNVIAHQSRWEGNWDPQLTKVTTSATPGEAYVKTTSNPTWSISLPRGSDPAGFLSALSLEPGTILTKAYFKLGADSRCDVVTDTTVGAVRRVCDQSGDVVRIDISGQGGTVLLDQALPTIP